MTRPAKASVLIVAKTHMGSGACVGGLSLSSNVGLRLLPRSGKCQPAETPFEVGQVWSILYEPVDDCVPPHVEDVRMLKQRLESEQAGMSAFLSQRVPIWKGGLDVLFGGSLTTTKTYRWRLTDSIRLSTCSVGYWMPDRDLYREDADGKIYFRYERRKPPQSGLVPYVGFGPVPPGYIIPAGSLVRVSLARWWASESDGQKSCYLQLSGWYSNEPEPTSKIMTAAEASQKALIHDGGSPPLQSQRAGDIHVGDRVKHVHYREGTVTPQNFLNALFGRVTVEFDRADTKRMSVWRSALERV